MAHVARALTLTIIDLSAASGRRRCRPQPAAASDLTRAGHGSLLLRDREHPQVRRAEHQDGGWRRLTLGGPDDGAGPAGVCGGSAQRRAVPAFA